MFQEDNDHENTLVFTSRVAAESNRGACSEAAEEEEGDICFFSHVIFIASLFALL